MELRRKPFQGVLNIIRFNWHFYLIAGFFTILLASSLFEKPTPYRNAVAVFLCLEVATIAVSLVVSYYIYDCSDLYQLNWLPNLDYRTTLNINAGFDETSVLIKQKFPNTDLTICDFFDAKKHTEISLRRARLKYPPEASTVKVTTDKLPFKDETFDFILAIFSAHEIRNQEERTRFFLELNRITKSDGCIFVTEHLRDRNNFLAYTVGFFHFYSKKTWKETFELSELKIETEIKTTPFVTTFKLLKYGNTF